VVLRQDLRLDSNGVSLSSSIFVPPGPGPHAGLVICHGMPVGQQTDTAASVDPVVLEGGMDYPALAEWCAWEGFATVIFNFRGTGQSGGNFHQLGWVQDLDAVVSWLHGITEIDPSRIVLLGSSLGAAVAIYVAAHRKDVAGLVSFASPAVMGERSQPAEAVERLRKLNMIRDPDFPPSLDEWAKEGEILSPVQWVGYVAPRPLLLLHGDADDAVSPDDAHILFECAGEGKELQMLAGVGHRFRQERTATGTALEWLKEKFLYPA
jgi:fermentation-respiration switch protein FrsA (DUF1100 family)